MDEKLTLQELMELLARKHDMEQEDAEAFVRMFFRLIEEALATDKYVKVKGLGTFKLIESQVGARISFTPDASMRDLVNKPFAHFETVVLNEDTHFDDMSEEENVSMLSTEMEEAFGEGEEETAAPPAEAVAPSSVSPCPPKEEETPTHLEASFPTSEEKKKIFRFPWCMLASILLIGVFVGGGMVWNFFSHKRYVSDSVLDSLISQRLNQTILIEQTGKADKKGDTTVIAAAELPVAETISRQTDTVGEARVTQPVAPEQEASKQNVQKREVPKQAAQKQTVQKQTVQKPESLSDTVEYQITGTQTTYTLRAGESLVKVAQKFYGNKRLWPYLVKHNSKTIKDANRVPAGATLEIPILSPKK